MGVKLKVPKLDWKGKALKLQRMVLCGAPLVEPGQRVLDMFEMLRKVMRGLAEKEELPAALSGLFEGPSPFMWEPYSSAKGDRESVYGWELDATLYSADGKPWWFVRAQNKLDDPPERSIVELERVVDCLGADVQRDRVINERFGNGYGCLMWWTWINQLPLLEMQVRRPKYPGEVTSANDVAKAMRIVEEGSPLPPGYERIERPPPDWLEREGKPNQTG